MNEMTSQIISLTIVYSTINSGTDQRKHHSPASLAFVREFSAIARKIFPFDDVIIQRILCPLKTTRDFVGSENLVSVTTDFR